MSLWKVQEAGEVICGCDIAIGFAVAAEVPVVMIGDIDRGGVIASLVGTQAVLASQDSDLIKGSSSTSSAAIRLFSPKA